MSQTPTMPAIPSTSAAPPQSSVGGLSAEMLESLRRDFEASAAYRLGQNALTQTSLDDVALNRQVIVRTDHTFSHRLDDWAVTNQKKSGRCWLFAGLNLFRPGAMKKMNLEEFEFSQNYMLFWDKLERANYFLEAVIQTADRPVDDRTVAFLLARPLDDGGQWNMFVNIVRKHGVVPRSAMPESESSSSTARMNGMLLYQLRLGAKQLRELRSGGAPMEAARAAKNDILKVVHRILCMHLGTPPRSFVWQWNDKDKSFHRDGEMTPLQFAEKYLTLPIDDYVCLVHDPRPDSPYGRTFTVEHLGNVADGEIVKYLNVEMPLMKDLARRTIMDGEPVWFGCDVGKMMRRDVGVWDRELFDYATLYDAPFSLAKADRLAYHETLMTHAMLFTGVDVSGEESRRWRVENSWGDENGQKGFFVMNDSWFDEYVFEIAVRRDRLPDELQRAAVQDPIVLPAWDPMGALA
jgi:bleomycin hydrolase